MKNKGQYLEKKKDYSKPILERIKIDNEISLIMTSPPGDPPEMMPGNNSGGIDIPPPPTD